MISDLRKLPTELIGHLVDFLRGKSDLVRESPAKDRGWIISVIVGLSYAWLIYSVAPLGSAFQFGESEGYELMKGFLCSLGHDLYGPFWNDQPPLHTALLCLLFKIFGPSLLVARLLALGFGALLVGSLYELARICAGHLAGITTTLILIAWSSFVRLSASVMLDPAAMALALVSVLLLMKAFRNGRKPEITECRFGISPLVASGVVMGLAIQTKLTVLMFLPAISIEFLPMWSAFSRMKDENPGAREAIGPWHLTFIWVGGLLVGVVAVRLLFPAETTNDLFYSHFSEATRSSLGGQYGFDPRFFSNEWIFIIPAIVGVITVFWTKDWLCLGPAILFLTVCLVHFFQRPFWFYYTLHFAIPTAWLLGIFVARLSRQILHSPTNGTSKLRSYKYYFGFLIWASALALLAAHLPERIQVALRSVIHVQLAEDNRIVKELRNHSKQAQWVFADSAIYAFHVGKPIPPEIAVIPEKRFWSKQISESQVATIITKYRPELIVVGLPSLRFALSNLLQTEYRETKTPDVFVRRAFSYE